MYLLGMHPRLAADLQALPNLLQQALAEADQFLSGLAERPVAVPLPPTTESSPLPAQGIGAARALAEFRARHAKRMSGSPGPRYLGFVTGGTTPAALAGDWLVSAYDQNLSSTEGSAAALVDAEAVGMLRELFGLPESFHGAFVTGATMANFVGLATARQWAGARLGVDVAEAGMGDVPFRVLSGTPHASALKALAMLGIGRSRYERLALLPSREALDPAALGATLAQRPEIPTIVIASAATVNTGDFDDLQAVADLCAAHGAWLHVDAAFGIFAACVPALAVLLRGLERADSIAADGHKWLNVPYDTGFAFVRHPELQRAVFQVSAPYLTGPPLPVPDPLNFTPENSSRFRALPTWMTLMAYGRDGYREIIERNCAFAGALGAWIDASRDFVLYAPVRLNCVCFGLAEPHLAGRDPVAAHRTFLDRVRDAGELFLTPTVLAGRAGMRAAVSNWRTTLAADLPRVTAALAAALPPG
jgi:glutamate/tyrosine decarboxylase-like PLP-dependent enzyme